MTHTDLEHSESAARTPAVAPAHSTPTSASAHDRADEEREVLLALGFPADPPRPEPETSPVASVERVSRLRRLGSWLARRWGRAGTRRLLTDQRGAVTAEYALVIMATMY